MPTPSMLSYIGLYKNLQDSLISWWDVHAFDILMIWSSPFPALCLKCWYSLSSIYHVLFCFQPFAFTFSLESALLLLLSHSLQFPFLANIHSSLEFRSNGFSYLLGPLSLLSVGISSLFPILYFYTPTFMPLSVFPGVPSSLKIGVVSYWHFCP